MGLTHQSMGKGVLDEMFNVQLNSPDEVVVALAGNPNTGKSTVFNSLTGLNQHTGNWPGKTVTNAQGRYGHRDKKFVLVDLPGTYSLLANSVEEEVARDFICFGKPQATVVVTDATSLERNLILVLQILEITDKVVLCVNLMDEAKRKGIEVDLKKLSEGLGVPVVGTNARDGVGLEALKDTVYQVALGEVASRTTKIQYGKEIEEILQNVESKVQEMVGGKLNSRWVALQLLNGDISILQSVNTFLQEDTLDSEGLDRCVKELAEFLKKQNMKQEEIQDKIVIAIVKTSEKIHRRVVHVKNEKYNEMDRKIDNILTSRMFGIPIMIALLGMVFWVTIQGANYPSEALASLFFTIEEHLSNLLLGSGVPGWVHGVLVLGIYRTLAWVISVMLPPMAIFFPLFTLMEDLGYLPRVAFNLDNFFKKACAHGKQALTMCMGFGCNAAGVIACRIIDSPRERLIAIITNNFVPCNGRFPILISMAVIFIGGAAAGITQSILGTIAVLGVIILGVVITLIVSKILSKTILKGLPSSFTLELPPYRKPQVGRILVRSILDRTLFVLGRAVMVAAPAGVVIWMMANIMIGDVSILDHCATFLEPFGRLIGMDGYIIMAFILGLPANEIVIPIIVMSYLSTGAMLELDSLEALRELLVNNGWTWLTAVCVMIFTLLHFPCGTTLLTIRKETQSKKWTFASFAIPTATGIIVCFVLAQTARLLGFV
ncbi:ferrous iron transport protein B [Clostridium formicaceticum]|uniref:Ferrous iron transport protein B n=1 Tax=Clostridium formicaceticum TaxID=1497 RepID=A0AAC9WFG0_9CLOT|nr:ferrous iron transport protein B [Clostridium formicaceticum]AOY76284.1 ferrous iron transport protein B [Clostridium formicaceticum]ARE86671.1 Ferrous iron transport protein B [Clostridium formicaceticum]